MSEDKQILDSIERIRSKYRSANEDEDEVELSFIDEVNQLLQRVFGDDSTNIYTTLSPEKLENWHKKRFRRFFRQIKTQNIMYLVLLLTIMGFLVSEAVSFYAIDGVISAKTWLKAILTETCFVFLSGYRSKSKWEMGFVSTLRAGTFALMMFVISSTVAFKGAGDVAEINNINQQIELIEKSIEKKEETIEFYKKKGWGISVNKHEKELTTMNEKLLKLKQEQISSKKSSEVSDLIVYKSWGRAAFRVILLFITVLISRRLFSF